MYYTFCDIYNNSNIPKIKTNIFIIKDNDITDNNKLLEISDYLYNKNVIVLLYSNNIINIKTIKPKYIIIDNNLEDIESIIINGLLIDSIPIFINEYAYNKYKYLCLSSLFINTSIDELRNNCSYYSNNDSKFNSNKHLDSKISLYISSNITISGIGGSNNLSKEVTPLLFNTFESLVDILKKEQSRISHDFIYLYPIDNTYIVERDLMKPNEKIFTKESDGYIHIRYRQENRLDNESLTPRLLPKNGVLGFIRLRDTYNSFPIAEEQILYKINLFFKQLITNHNMDCDKLSNTGVDLYYDNFKFLSGEYFVDKSNNGGTLLMFFIYMEFDSLKDIFNHFCKDSKHKYKGLSEIIPNINRKELMIEFIEFMVGEYI